MSPHWTLLLSLLVLILVANGLPALLGLVLGPARPVDGGRHAADGHPVLGPSKTWRGLASSLLATPLLALALGLPWMIGLAVAVGAMAGDLIVSYAKRRRGLPSSAPVPWLDPLPESLLPGVLVMGALGLGWLDILLLVLAFAALDLILTPIGRRVFGPRHRSEP